MSCLSLIRDTGLKILHSLCTFSYDGNMKTSVDGHPRVYMSFSSQKSHVGKMIEDRNQVRCSYCGRQFIRK